MIENCPQQIDTNTPGPGNYNYIKPLGKDACKFSIRGKGNNKNDIKIKIPGPGEYSADVLNPKGVYPRSCQKNTVNICFGQLKEKRFQYEHDKGINLYI